MPWRGLLVAVVLLTLAAAVAWELFARSVGYAPTLNDTNDLWAERREAVKPDSVVIVGDSRALFDFDLNELTNSLNLRASITPNGRSYPRLIPSSSAAGW